MKNLQGGGLLLTCQTTDDSERLQQLIEKNTEGKFNVYKPKSKRPTIKVINIRNNYDKEVLKEVIMAQNSYLHASQIEIKYIKEIKHKHTWTAYIGTDGKAFRDIMDNGRLYIGWDSCKVFEEINVLRCFNCCGFYHKSKDCRLPVTCVKCGKGHNKKDCSETLTCCINCRRQSEKDNLNRDTNHEASSINCSIYKTKLERVVNQIDYSL